MGKVLAKKIKSLFEIDVNYGELDTTFYRDDFRRNNKQLIPNEVNIDFNSMKEFFLELAGFEEYLMLDSYTADLQTRSRIYIEIK